MRKSVKIIYMAIMAVFLLLPVIVFKTFQSHFDTANYTNSELAAKPELSLSLESIEAFPEAFDNWFSDHLPFKNELLTLNGHIDYDVLKSTNSDSVIIGKDGWLFYKGAQVNSEDPVADYAGTNLFTDEELAKIAENMEAARDGLQELNHCRFVVYLAPNKERVYGDKMPEAYGDPQYGRIQQVYDYLKNNTDIEVVTALDTLEEYRQENPDDQIYFKYDTHWNELGAYIGSRPLSEALGFETKDPSELLRFDGGQGNFDLARLLHLGTYLSKDHAYVLSGYTDFKKEEIVEQHNDSYNQFYFYNTTNNAAHEVCYVVGDSFSSYLAPYIACNYNNTYVDFYYNYDFKTLQEHNPSIFVYETVERYIGNMLDFSLYSGIGKNS